jgi:hypothetical protein
VAIEDQPARVETVVEVLVHAGHTNFAVGFDPIEDAIRVRLGASDLGSNAVDEREVLAASARLLVASSDPQTADRVRAIDWNTVRLEFTGDGAVPGSETTASSSAPAAGPWRVRMGTGSSPPAIAVA